MKYITPITDRTLLDVTNRTAKAFLNIADWMRIYNNAQVAKIIVDFLQETEITFNAVDEPTILTIPSVTDLNTLLANINRIVSASGLPAITGISTITDDWTAGTSSDAPDYTDVNQWETVINTLYNIVGNAADYRIYCGVSAVGQPRFWQNRFRRFPWVADAVSPVRRIRAGMAVSGVGLMRNNGFRRYT